MNGLNLAKQTELKICPCEIISENVSCEISLNGVKNLLQKFKNQRANFVAWQIQNIIWGKYDGEKLFSRAEITPQFWIECRIFNEAEELHLKRVEKNLSVGMLQKLTAKKIFMQTVFQDFGAKIAARRTVL